MSRWETQRKPWNKAPGWRGETPEEQKGSLLCNGPLVVYSSRLSALATAVIPIRSDGNTSHIFSPHWSPHARFHGVVSMGMPALLAPASVFLLWRRSTDPETATTMAALIPITYWGPFFVALVIPGAGLVDPGQRLTRIAGVPSPLLSAAATILTAGVGCYLARSGDAAASCEARCASRGCFYPRAGMRTFPLWESSETEHPMEGRKE